MGILDFFRKKPEVKIEKLSMNNLDSWIQDKEEQNKAKEESLVQEIKNRILNLIDELENKKQVLYSIDISGKKVEERAKLIVKENLNHYIANLDKLLKELGTIQEDNLDSLIKETESIFLDFEKRSSLNFEKATFLIGRELEDVRKSIADFFTFLNRIIRENHDLIESSNLIPEIELKLNEFNELTALNLRIEKNLLDNLEKIIAFQKKVKLIDSEIKSIRNSEEYGKEKQEEKEIQERKHELEKEIYSFKEMIDFKKLANIFHYDPKKMNTINDYKMNFLASFQKNNGFPLISILDEANINDSLILKKINDIKQKNKEIEKNINELDNQEEKTIELLEKNIKSLNLDIFNLNQENLKDKKRQEKIKEKQSELKDLIKNALAKLNVEFID